MCGIVAYIGKKQVVPILTNGLRRLEYRGYDSSGVAVLNNQQELVIVKTVGKIAELDSQLGKISDIEGCFGIAHTRWATHGGVTKSNAHPHIDCLGNIAVVHNGIIENYRELKEKFLKEHKFVSETDTEVLVHLIEHFYKNSLRQAVLEALSLVKGTYGLVVMDKREPGILIVARRGSPLAIGIGENEYYVASDASPILPYTKQIIFLDDGELAEISQTQLNIFTLKNQSVTKHPEHIEWNGEQAEKQGFPHFMLKEIFDQPTVFQDAIRGRYDLENGTAHLGGLNISEEEIRSINRVVFVACGTASYAALVGKYLFENLVGIVSEVEVASEFRYRNTIIDRHTLVFGVSQSGETADTLAALREAKRKGAYVRGIVNVVGSTIARETEGGTYIHAGPELSVASTKAYTNMVAVMVLYALQFGRVRGVHNTLRKELLREFLKIPEKMKTIFEENEHVKLIAQKYKDYQNFLFLGRGINYPVALEGSLKLKEISYIHSEALPGGEMKHGPIALLSPDFPVLAILTKNSLYDKMRSNIEEVLARKSPVILVVNNDKDAQGLSQDFIRVPSTLEFLEPLINTIPLQLFAYHTAVLLGKDVDRPRNLAKSVTVE